MLHRAFIPFVAISLSAVCMCKINCVFGVMQTAR